MDELTALSILTQIPLLGPVKMLLLHHHFGSFVQTLEASAAEILTLPGFGPKALARWGFWKKEDSWKENLELAHQAGVKLIPYTDPSYPKLLLQTPDFPPLLYVQGNLGEEDSTCIGIVGTRTASKYGIKMAEIFAQDLARSGMVVVSGLARGIDTWAHQGSFEVGRTFAVLGSGLANLYPKENSLLANRITENGALISEYPMRTPPDRKNFPRRNRIVAGLSHAMLLIEAPEKSGALITLDKALQYQRPCFAIPGRIDTPDFIGNHTCIKEGKATLVTHASDLICTFGHNSLPKVPKTPLPSLEKEEEELLNQMPIEEFSMEEIHKKTNLPVTKLTILLMSLVIKKVIREFPGKMYQVILPQKERIPHE